GPDRPGDPAAGLMQVRPVTGGGDLMRLSVIRTAVCLIVVAVLAAAGPAHADPESSLDPLPPEIVEGLDDVVPAPLVPSLDTIPQRATAPGFDHETLELREAVLPDPVGDPFFDDWPDGLEDRENGEVLEVRDVTPVAGFLVTVPLEYATMVKFRSTDLHG